MARQSRQVTKSIRLTEDEARELAALVEGSAVSEAGLMRQWVLHGMRQFRVEHTVRTQSHFRRLGTGRTRRRAGLAQRDNMPHLQVILVNHDALDQQLQDRLLLFKGCGACTPRNARAERPQIGQHHLGLRAFCTKPVLLRQLVIDRLAA
jgi:hypothetical protein